MRMTLLRESHIKESRVALTPKQVGELTLMGHQVDVQFNAGMGSGFENSEYEKVGAQIIKGLSALKHSELIIKVKEPTIDELNAMHRGGILFCFLHLAALPKILKKILQKRITAIGYETVEKDDGSLPLLKPMSEIAGKLATQNGAHFLRADKGGRGILLGGTKTVEPAEVVILGGGIVGENAAKVALGLGAHTHVLELSIRRRAFLRVKLGRNLQLYTPNVRTIKEMVRIADLLIGAVLIPGAHAPKLVTKDMVKTMKKGSVIVDVSVDQGGCIETSKVTSADCPVFRKYGVLHYGVPNIPGSVPVTSTLALSTVTFPYIKRIARLGLKRCCQLYPEIARAINCEDGKIVHRGLK